MISFSMTMVCPSRNSASHPSNTEQFSRMAKLMPSIAADGFAQSERYSRAGIYAKPLLSRAGGRSEIEAGIG
jgi:hypothetical protein